MHRPSSTHTCNFSPARDRRHPHHTTHTPFCHSATPPPPRSMSLPSTIEGLGPVQNGGGRVAASMLTSKGKERWQRLPSGMEWGTRSSPGNMTRDWQKRKKRNVPYTTQQMIARLHRLSTHEGEGEASWGALGGRGRRVWWACRVSSSSASQWRKRVKVAEGTKGTEGGGLYASLESRSGESNGRLGGNRGAGGRVIRKDGCETFSTPSDPVLDAPTVVRRRIGRGRG
ncbi:hypothetical protein P171DRAFT_98369 [Karstenula rhodostoma CBS 690.94]|uniref:Uncharacterized protein n=1 Tax=Karstenula rhodostoma CBS 690.94 TaxID=1392251 RepID=A0A9P4PBC7_9PLEO|nr:hypothetical protein P171DRAFT_98369 [Karstenula rhodostoma CBS 690.94]